MNTSPDQSLLRHARWRLSSNTVGLFDPGSERTKLLALTTAAIAWLPTAILALIQGPSYFRLFLIDFAAQSRLLVVIPLMIVAEPWMIERWEMIARHFMTIDLIRKEDDTRFREAFETFEKERHRWSSQLAILVAVYGVAVAAVPYVHLVPPWCSGTEVFGKMSLPGASYLLVSLPVLVYLVFRWIWNIALWSLFLCKVSMFNLRLVPSHPDLMGGLSFLETSLRGYLPFAFSIGTIVAGGIANQTIHLKKPLTAFRVDGIFMVVLVILICVAPLCTFYESLMQAKRRGTFEYGSLAVGIGHHFEVKWLKSAQHVDATALEAPDFSSTTDSYSIVANVRQMKPVPFGVQAVTRLVVFTLIPVLPVALSSVPFDVLLDRIIKLLL
jgi:hypothetical protein